MDKDLQRTSDLSTESASSDQSKGEFVFGNKVIMHNVSYEGFCVWLDEQDESDHKRWWYVNKSILITEYPRQAHESAASFFGTQIERHMTYKFQLSEVDPRPLKVKGSADRRLSNSCKQPDESITVARRGCPNLVVEIARSQTVESLHTVCSNYFTQSNNIMIVVGVKIFTLRIIEGIVHRPMVLFLYLRQAAQTRRQLPYYIQNMISFGNIELSSAEADQIFGSVSNYPPLVGVGCLSFPACDRRELPEYQLSIPYAHLLCIGNTADEAEVAEAYRQNWTLDLHALQEEILEGTEEDLANGVA
jgi:hypothetical protein